MASQPTLAATAATRALDTLWCIDCAASRQDAATTDAGCCAAIAAPWFAAAAAAAVVAVAAACLGCAVAAAAVVVAGAVGPGAEPGVGEGEAGAARGVEAEHWLSGDAAAEEAEGPPPAAVAEGQ